MSFDSSSTFQPCEAGLGLAGQASFGGALCQLSEQAAGLRGVEAFEQFNGAQVA